MSRIKQLLLRTGWLPYWLHQRWARPRPRYIATVRDFIFVARVTADENRVRWPDIYPPEAA